MKATLLHNLGQVQCQRAVTCWGGGWSAQGSLLSTLLWALGQLEIMLETEALSWAVDRALLCSWKLHSL